MSIRPGHRDIAEVDLLGPAGRTVRGQADPFDALGRTIFFDVEVD